MRKMMVAIALSVAGCGPALTGEQRVAQAQDGAACRARCEETYVASLARCASQDGAELRQRCREVAAQVRDRCAAACPR